MKKRLNVHAVSERQLANTSTSCRTLPSEVVGGADREGLTTHPPPGFAFSEHHRFMSCPVVWFSIHECVCEHVVALSLRGGRVHTSLFVLCYDPNTLAAALPSLIGGPHSISAMPARDGRSVLIFL